MIDREIPVRRRERYIVWMPRQGASVPQPIIDTIAEVLVDALHDARAKVRHGYPWWLKPWLVSDVVAITLGHRIYLAARVAPASIERLLRHELAHVRQVNRHGLLGFYGRYLAEFARHFVQVRSVHRAYAMISFEREAVMAEREIQLESIIRRAP